MQLKNLVVLLLLAVSSAWGVVTAGTTPVEMFGWNNVSSPLPCKLPSSQISHLSIRVVQCLEKCILGQRNVELL